MFKKLLFLVVPLILLIACKQKSRTGDQQVALQGVKPLDGAINDTASTIYLVGSQSFANGKQRGILWVGGKQLVLFSTDENEEASAVYVQHNDIYVVGVATSGNSEETLTSYGKMWKNGAVQILSENKIGQRGSATDIYVDADTTYVVGTRMNSSGYLEATLWKNGQAIRLGKGQRDSYASSVFVADGDVYVCGYENSASGQMQARLWKNGQIRPLGATQGASNALSVFVADHQVYVAGFQVNQTDQRVATLWRNGEVVILSNGLHDAMLTTVSAVGGKVYCGGYEMNLDGFETATLWEDKEPIRLSQLQVDSRVVAVSANQHGVYAVVDQTDKAGNTQSKVWNNGHWMQLSGLASQSVITDIFLGH